MQWRDEFPDVTEPNEPDLPDTRRREVKELERAELLAGQMPLPRIDYFEEVRNDH